VDASDDHSSAAEEQLEAWKRAAVGWERWQVKLREITQPVTDWLVGAIDAQPGERVLDLAAGPGETGFAVAQRLGSEGSLMCTDQSTEMVAVATRRAAELGLTNVEFAAINAEELALEADSFDAVLCRWGYMLMADPLEAARRTNRVLRRGGRLALAVWGPPDRNVWLAAIAMQLVARGALPPPDPTSPGPFALADRDKLEQLLTGAGFEEISIDSVEFFQTYTDGDEYWQMQTDLAAPLAAALAPLGPDQVNEIRAGVRESLQQFAGADGQLAIPAQAITARAVAG
jgi:SAM-dependent methyltransferase